jgi:hypothetical protein
VARNSSLSDFSFRAILSDPGCGGAKARGASTRN